MVSVKFIGKLGCINYSKLLLAMGIIFSCIVLTDFILIKAMAQFTENHPPGSLVLDWHPLPEMVSFVLNWIILLVVVALLLIAYTDKNELKKRAGFIGAILSLISIAGLIYLVQSTLVEYLGESLGEMIWWY
jgi:uncharacterized BrkB/YihY/UPF0761 family membrane protein